MAYLGCDQNSNNVNKKQQGWRSSDSMLRNRSGFRPQYRVSREHQQLTLARAQNYNRLCGQVFLDGEVGGFEDDDRKRWEVVNGKR